MSDVTRILSKIESGDPLASEQLFPLVYQELRKLAASRMAGERPDHTLQATALVHEAYVRVVANVVKLRFFAGLTRQETADALGVSLTTVDDDWAYAKGRLRVDLA